MKIIIIGAGITGLSAAYFFGKKGHEVTVVEKEEDIGGLAGTFPINGVFLEKYYHHSFAGHTDLLALMKELNIYEHYFSRNAKTGFYYNNKIYPFVRAKDLLFFKPLSFLSRIRLGVTSLLMMRINDWRKLEQHTALEWLQKYSGKEVCKIIWEPLLSMKFGDSFSKISAAWLWNRVKDRKRAGGGKDLLGYMKGGYKTLLDALKKNIERQGGKIMFHSRVQMLTVENGNISGVKIGGALYDADMVLSTIAIPDFIRISPSLPDEYVASLSSIKYQGSICVVLKSKQPLSNYYWINVSDQESPFVGIIEHTNFVSPEDYGNDHVIYLTKYASSSSRLFSVPEEEIYRDFTNYLKNMFPDFNKEDVLEYWVFKNRLSQPVFVKNYSKILPEYRTPIGNLFILNTAQIYPQSRSLNSSIKMSREMVREMLSSYEK